MVVNDLLMHAFTSIVDSCLEKRKVGRLPDNSHVAIGDRLAYFYHLFHVFILSFCL